MNESIKKPIINTLKFFLNFLAKVNQYYLYILLYSLLLLSQWFYMVFSDITIYKNKYYQDQ